MVSLVLPAYKHPLKGMVYMSISPRKTVLIAGSIGASVLLAAFFAMLY